MLDLLTLVLWAQASLKFFVGGVMSNYVLLTMQSIVHMWI